MLVLFFNFRGCHKSRPQLEGEFVKSGQGGVLKMRTSIFCAKHRIFLNLWCVRTDRGVSQCGHLRRRGDKFFVILRRRFLWKTPYLFIYKRFKSLKLEMLTINSIKHRFQCDEISLQLIAFFPTKMIIYA